MLDKKRKLAVITGAGHRLGRYIAIYLSKKGFEILIHYNQSAEKANNTYKKITENGGIAYLFKADLTRENEINGLWKYIDELNIQLEVLINSAAIMKEVGISEISSADFDQTMMINLRAPFINSQEAAKRMIHGGVIINISDGGAEKNWSRYPIYLLSKFALENLTRIHAKALAPKIRVNALAPGLVIPNEKVGEENWNKLVEKVPLKRAANKKELYMALDFILNNEYLTGQILRIDGGYSII